MSASPSPQVLTVTPRFYPHAGGVETHVFEVGRRVAAAGARMTVLTTDVSRALAPREELEGIEIVRVPAYPRSKDWYVAPAIGRVIADAGADVIHVQSYHSMVAPLAMLAARRNRIPYVVTFHSGGHSSGVRTRARALQLRTLRPLLEGAARRIAVSPYEARRFGSVPGLTGAIDVVPNGAELTLPSVLPVPVAGLIVSPGRLERYKGHHRVIEALPHLLARVPEARVRIAGNGPYEPELHRRAAELGVADRVQIAGIPAGDRVGMATLLASASVVAVLSEYESQGISAVEAAMLGRPIVVTDATALHELVERGVAEGIPANSTPEAVAAALEQQLRRPMVATTQHLPTWDDCATGILQIYRDVVGVSSCGS
ncbi:MAG TPA: glycosyltransferase family 4 protein [Baekduia sp.]|uniref:glycosyltransferase family 4 protein n=1 Tax=Baekduia sp. TaxID=2600305 RepID=UPI002C6A9ABC|nr:glycosyltransferase family 4 protein [Baekduia sp.]HMJ35918.1 glycosyltransferase family 4 protein [Baekduia sp.]